MDSVIRSFFNQYLSTFFYPLHQGCVELSLEDGITFRNLHIRPDGINQQLEANGVDLRIKDGYVGQMKIAYTALPGMVTLQIKNCDIRVQPNALKTIGRSIANAIDGFINPVVDEKEQWGPYAEDENLLYAYAPTRGHQKSLVRSRPPRELHIPGMMPDPRTMSMNMTNLGPLPYMLPPGSIPLHSSAPHTSPGSLLHHPVGPVPASASLNRTSMPPMYPLHEQPGASGVPVFTSMPPMNVSGVPPGAVMHPDDFAAETRGLPNVPHTPHSASTSSADGSRHRRRRQHRRPQDDSISHPTFNPRAASSTHFHNNHNTGVGGGRDRGSNVHTPVRVKTASASRRSGDPATGRPPSSSRDPTKYHRQHHQNSSSSPFAAVGPPLHFHPAPSVPSPAPHMVQQGGGIIFPFHNPTPSPHHFRQGPPPNAPGRFHQSSHPR